MKYMKLGSRPDAFYTTESIRSVASEVATDLRIQIQNNLYHLHKFPLLSKCLKLQKICSELKDTLEETIICLDSIPGGAEAFEICAKFCYGITITISAINFVPARCAAEYLQMTEDIDHSNLIAKLDIFFRSCVLRRWKDTLVALQSTRQYHPQCEELGITGQCIDSIATSIIAKPTDASDPNNQRNRSSKDWWTEDISELGIDHFFRTLIGVKSAGVVPCKVIGKALQVYMSRWLQNLSTDGGNHSKKALLLEKIVSLLPTEKGSVSCNFLSKLLKAANMLNSSISSKTELIRRIGLQLEEATVSDLLIPNVSGNNKMIYDVEMVRTMLEEFKLQGSSPPISPPRAKLRSERRRSRSADNVDFDLQENSRRSSSASHSSKLRVAKLIDGYLQEIAHDENLPLDLLINLAESVTDFARTDHDDLYKVIDTYLRAHPELNKNERKNLCRILDCKKLSVEACMHAAQNELLPLRVVVQVLFFEQSRAAMSNSQVSDLPSNIKALLARSTAGNVDTEALKLHQIGTTTPMNDAWRISALKCPMTKITTLKMKLTEDANDIDDDIIPRDALMRSASSRFRALCSLPNKPKRILGKFWTMNRSASQRN